MSQVSLLSVDVSQSTDIKGTKGEATIKSSAKNSAFSDAMEQHYSTKNTIESNAKNIQNGNVQSKAATSQADANYIDLPLKQIKAIKADDAHILPVPLPIDDEALAEKLIPLKAKSDARTLPVPLPVDDEALTEKLVTALKVNDDAHILPVPLPVDDEALTEKAITTLKATDDAHILPVPLPVDDAAIAEKVSATLKSSDDAHILPVTRSLDGKPLPAIAKSTDEYHILPVPSRPENVVNKNAKQEGVTVNYQPTVPKGQQTLSFDSHEQLQSQHNTDKSVKNTETVDLLKMLNSAQKLLIKSSAAPVNFEQNTKVLAVNAEHTLVNNKSLSQSEKVIMSESSTDEKKAKALATSENTTKQFVDKLTAVDSASAAKNITTAQASINTLMNDQALNDEQISATAAKPESKTAIENSAISLQANNELKTQASFTAHELELTIDKKNTATKSSAAHQAIALERDSAKVREEMQVNLAELKAVSGNEQKQTGHVNQSTASIVAAQISDFKGETRQKTVVNESVDKLASTELNVEQLAKAEHEKQTQQPDKPTSIFNQTLDAHTAKNQLSSGELAAQQQQNFENTINKITTDTVQTQKSITAINNETIAIYRKDFANAVKDKVMVMINQKIQQVEIQLDPPEMGNIHVRVNLQNEQAAVQFVVQNQQAKDALEQNIGKLRDMLAENGVDVGDASIEHHDGKEQDSDDVDGQNARGQQGDLAEDLSAETDNTVLNLAKASSTGIDYYA